MDASQLLWEKWQEQVKGLFPTLHGHQQKLLALLVAGMVVSGCAMLQRMAETIQQQGWSEAKMSSIERRLERFLANEQVEVTAIWKAFLQSPLQAAGKIMGSGGSLRIPVKKSGNFQAMMTISEVSRICPG